MTRWVRFSLPTGTEGFGQLSDDDASIAVYSGDMFADPVDMHLHVGAREVQLGLPSAPSKVICLWNNFRALADKTGDPHPSTPLWFLKSPNAWRPSGARIPQPVPDVGRVAYEGELGIVIGRRTRAVSEADAAKHIFGYTCVNDVTALTVLTAEPGFAQWARAKGMDGFGPIGPCVATGLAWESLEIITRVSGRERQRYPAADMILPPARIVSLLSQELTLEAGDVIACGTSLGVLPMKPGSVVEVEIPGIGILQNPYE